MKMTIKCFLTVNSSGSIRVTKGRPALDFDEITIGLNLELPKALFDKPQLSAHLTIPDDAALPRELPVDVVANVHEAIQQASGMSVKLSVVGPEGN